MTRLARYRIASNVAWVDSVEGQDTAAGSALPEERRTEAWVATLPDGQPLSLNGSGLAIWLACAADEQGTRDSSDGKAELGSTVEEIAARVRGATGIDDVPTTEVAAFLDALVGRGLVGRVPVEE